MTQPLTDLTPTPRMDDLLDCYAAAGDEIATVYVPALSAHAEAEQRFAIRTKNTRTALEDGGAPKALTDRIIGALDDHQHDDGAALVIAATADRLLLDLAMARPVAKAVTSVGATPLLLPMISATQVDEPHLAVLLDRTGADVYRRSGVGAPLDTMEIEGDDVRVHRGHPGGWSQRRFQQIAENAWESNAKDVVSAVTDEYGTDLPMIVAGDERAVGFFTEHLPAAVTVVEVEGSRHADHDAFLDAADEAMRTRAARRIVERLDQFRSSVGADRGATGLEVLELLSRGQVDHLLVGNDSFSGERPTARFDFSVPMYRLDDDHGPSTIAPVTDGAVALARATGAGVTVVPASLPDIEQGLGAILRF